MFWLLLPLVNYSWSCTLDAWIHCEMWENRQKIEKVSMYDYITPITRYRDRMRRDMKPWWTNNTLKQLKEKWYIEDRDEIAPRLIDDSYRGIMEIRNAEHDWLHLWSGTWNENHTVCVIWENKDNRVVINDWWKQRGNKWYWLVKKWDWLIYFTYK